jgi:hypothetical protein
MLIVGGGIIGLEMGTVYSTLGARLDVVEMLEGLIRSAEKVFPEAIFAVHLDHGDLDTCMDCINSGVYSSVMIDASHHPLEKNIEITKRVVEAAHAPSSSAIAISSSSRQAISASMVVPSLRAGAAGAGAEAPKLKGAGAAAEGAAAAAEAPKLKGAAAAALLASASRCRKGARSSRAP